MNKNKNLLLKFFSRCHHVGVPGGEIHIVHKTKASYSHWNIIELAEKSGLLFLIAPEDNSMPLQTISYWKAFSFRGSERSVSYTHLTLPTSDLE